MKNTRNAKNTEIKFQKKTHKMEKKKKKSFTSNQKKPRRELLQKDDSFALEPPCEDDQNRPRRNTGSEIHKQKESNQSPNQSKGEKRRRFKGRRKDLSLVGLGLRLLTSGFLTSSAG